MKIYYANQAKDKLKNTIKDLQKSNLLSAEAVEMIEKITQDEVLYCLINGVEHGEKYPESVRKFCFTVHYHSIAAYEIIRNQFNKNLPHSKTIKAPKLQLSDVSGEPGIQKQTMDILRKIVDESDEPLVCALIVDEMYLRKQVYYDHHAMKYVGYISYPKQDVQLIEPENFESTSEQVPETAIAKQAIVFMLCGLNKYFQYPVAYHFIDQKMNVNERSYQ